MRTNNYLRYWRVQRLYLNELPVSSSPGAEPWLEWVVEALVCKLPAEQGGDGGNARAGRTPLQPLLPGSLPRRGSPRLSYVYSNASLAPCPPSCRWSNWRRWWKHCWSLLTRLIWIAG